MAAISFSEERKNGYESEDGRIIKENPRDDNNETKEKGAAMDAQVLLGSLSQVRDASMETAGEAPESQPPPQPVQAAEVQERPWTREENRRFFRGLIAFGRPDWKGISRHYVVTRTPEEVSVHAEEHMRLLRQCADSSLSGGTAAVTITPTAEPSASYGDRAED